MQHQINKDSLKEKLLKLQNEYASNIPERLKLITRLWKSYQDDTSEQNYQPLLTEVHKIAGTATMYGLKDLGEIAFHAEEEILALKNRTVNTEKAGKKINALIKWRKTIR